MTQAQPQIQIFTFGTLQVVRGDHMVTESDWHTRQARQLLKILVTERPRPVSTDRLIEILWPQSTPDAAATTLRSAINALRNVLEPERPNRAPSRYIMTQAPGYAFHLHPEIWLDVEIFEQRLHTAQHMADLVQRRQLIEEAVSLYQDDYLVSDPYADWATTERDRLRERYFTGLLQLAEIEALEGDYAEAISTVRLILARDEVRENAYQALMRYQAESGDSAGALLSYERCRTILANELGADPSPLTQQWHQRILSGDVTPRATALLYTTTIREATPASQPAAPTPAATLPQHLFMPSVDVRHTDLLVGREQELNALCSCLTEALGGHGTLVVLEGEAGVGKTRLAVGVLQVAADTQATVISATCQAIEKNLPFAALADVLGRYLHRVPTEALHLLPTASLAQMAQIVPSLYDRIQGLPQPTAEPVPTPEENRLRLIDGIVTFLAALARLRPLALFLDDLHWADADTLAVISRLMQRLNELPLFLLLAYRSDDLPENEALATLLHAIRRQNSGQRLEVNRFDAAQVQRYVDLLMGRETVFGDELARLLYELTQGNPLFVAEMVRDLQERHPTLDPAVDQGAGNSSNGAPNPELSRSWSSDLRKLLTARPNQRIQELIQERIERLPGEALWVLQLSAVIARDYRSELLESAATQDPIDGLEILLQRKFLIERPDQRLDFSHQLVRQEAYDSMSALQRRRWHLRVADALVLLHRADHNPAEAAFHYGQAGAAAQLPYARYSVHAGEKLLRAYGFRQAIEFFDTALDTLANVIDAPPDLTERALQGRGLAYESLFDLDGVTDSYRRLLAWASHQGDRTLILKTHSRMATVLGIMGQDRESNELLQELMSVLNAANGPDDDTPVTSRVITDLLERRRIMYSADDSDDGAWAPYTPPPPVVHEPVRDILQVLEPLHAVLPLFDYGWTLLVQGQMGEATDCLSAVVDLASDTAQPSIVSTALHQLAVTARILGELEQSQALNEQSVTINREVPGTASELASMWPRIASALLSLQAGRLDEAERRLRRVIDFLGARDSYRNYRNSANIGLGLVELARSNLPQARTLLEGALLDPVNLYPYMHVRALLGLARIARLEGNPARADTLLRQALRYSGRRSLLEEYMETLLEIAVQRPPDAPTEALLEAFLRYVRPIKLEAAIRRLEAALLVERQAAAAGG
jgi:DNA-binding SARP family transcriptional activator